MEWKYGGNTGYSRSYDAMHTKLVRQLYRDTVDVVKIIKRSIMIPDYKLVSKRMNIDLIIRIRF